MATGRAFDPRRFDVAAFAASGASLAGEWPLATLPRLASAGVGRPSEGEPVRWRVTGQRARLGDAGVQAALQLVADGALEVECQRCLQAMTVPLNVERRLFFVEGEDAAAALDADSEDDVLTLEPAIDLRALLEDELLLALPLVPRHEACPEPLPLRGEDDGPAAEHPFAALAALRRKPGPA
ncbi:MAG: YceD family protein [Caldimonas sp.]